MVRNNKKKTCYDCKHKIVITEKDHYDLGGDETVNYECIHSRVKYSFLANNNFNYNIMAEKCEYFQSKKYSYNCLVCMETFDFKQPEWEYWTDNTGYAEPLCSQECVSEYSKEKGQKVVYRPSDENLEEVDVNTDII